MSSAAGTSSVIVMTPVASSRSTVTSARAAGRQQCQGESGGEERAARPRLPILSDRDGRMQLSAPVAKDDCAAATEDELEVARSLERGGHARQRARWREPVEAREARLTGADGDVAHARVVAVEQRLERRDVAGAERVGAVAGRGDEGGERVEVARVAGVEALGEVRRERGERCARRGVVEIPAARGDVVARHEVHELLAEVAEQRAGADHERRGERAPLRATRPRARSPGAQAAAPKKASHGSANRYARSGPSPS